MIIDTERENQIKKIAEYNAGWNTDYTNIEIKLIEEMAELTQAILKYDLDQQAVIEETADVIITLRQLMKMLDTNKLDEAIEFKLKRTMERLKLED